MFRGCSLIVCSLFLIGCTLVFIFTGINSLYSVYPEITRRLVNVTILSGVGMGVWLLALISTLRWKTHAS